nr:Epstein-Barr nuclear antigen 2 like [Ipomoea batatas]
MYLWAQLKQLSRTDLLQPIRRRLVHRVLESPKSQIGLVSSGSRFTSLSTSLVLATGDDSAVAGRRTLSPMTGKLKSSTLMFYFLKMQFLESWHTASHTAVCMAVCFRPNSTCNLGFEAWISRFFLPFSIEKFSFLYLFSFARFMFITCVFPTQSQTHFLFYGNRVPSFVIAYCPAPVVLRTFFVTVGTDVELCFMRTFGYMLAKWLILREVGGVGLQSLTPQYLGISYSTEAYGLWILKGYAPVRAMRCTLRRRERNPFPVIEAQESALRYALAHQQLEAVIQFEYTVGYFDGFIQVNARLDNIRLHVARLGFNKSEDNAYVDEKHFPSRIRVWVGPEVGASYVGGMSLGQSTNNIEKEVETHKIWKGSFGDSKVPKMKAVARMATKTKMKNWRWDQDAEGNAVVYDATLCDNQTGIEVATWKPDNGDDGPTGVVMNNLGRRYRGANRGFTKKGSLVIAGEESGTGVGWRLSKEMVGSVLKWRIGGEVWLTYWPNHVNTSYYETRCVEWCDEVVQPVAMEKKRNRNSAGGGGALCCSSSFSATSFSQ